MANLPEPTPAEWVDGVYQIETTDPVLGGPPNEQTRAGLSNLAAWQLARRTGWLKSRLDALVAKVWTNDAPRLLQANGHQRLGPEGGLIFQWGRGTFNAAPTAVNFPIAFPTACLAVIPGDMATNIVDIGNAAGAHPISVIRDSITRTGFTGFARVNGDSNAFADTNFTYFAIGH